jgi:hypothetical protein
MECCSFRLSSWGRALVRSAVHVGVDVLSKFVGHVESLEERVEVAGGSLVDQTLVFMIHDSNLL